MPKYVVNVPVTGWTTVEVEADSESEAINQAVIMANESEDGVIENTVAYKKILTEKGTWPMEANVEPDEEEAYSDEEEEEDEPEDDEE